MKSLDETLREREEWRRPLFAQLHNVDRRTFLQGTAPLAAPATAAAGGIVPHSFQLVELAHAAKKEGAEKSFSFSFGFAYISNTYRLASGRNDRFVKAALKAVKDGTALDPQPDFVLFGGDLAQLRQKEELELGKQSLSELKAPVKMMVGEDDWYLDMEEKWRELFGEPTYSFDHKGVHFLTLNSVIEQGRHGWSALRPRKDVEPIESARSRYVVPARASFPLRASRESARLGVFDFLRIPAIAATALAGGFLKGLGARPSITLTGLIR